MRILHILLALAGALLLGVWLAGPISEDPGYVLIRFQGWALETTAVAVIVCVIALYFIWRILKWTLRQPRKAAAHLIERHEQARLERGLLALTEGRWQRAEKLLSQSARDSQLPTVHYLAAARAAQGRDADSQRDAYLLQAEGTGRNARFAVDLTRAELLLADDDAAGACLILQSLKRQRPRNAHVLQLLSRCYQKLERYEELRALVPDLRKAKVVDEPEAELLLHQATAGALRRAPDYHHLHEVWASLPRRFRRDSALLQPYCEAALAFGKHEEIEKLLRKHLKRHWDAALVLLYGKAQTAAPTEQLKSAESWLKDHPDDAALMLTLGRLCARAELWGKARDYYQRALDLEPSAAAYRELGALHDQQGDTRSAMACYRNMTRLPDNPSGIPAESRPD